VEKGRRKMIAKKAYLGFLAAKTNQKEAPKKMRGKNHSRVQSMRNPERPARRIETTARD
jgi:hypothetical protein